MTASERPPLVGLYALTPDTDDTAALLVQVAALLEGGVRWLQYRNKHAAPALRRAQATELLQLCRRHRAALIVNDDVELALSIGADGVHLGADDGDLARARERLGPSRVLGASCYADLERARVAARAGADYLAFGAVFASSTKPQAAHAPLELLDRAKAEFGLPIAAIGGINVHNAGDVIAAGADLLAVITDLFSAPDPRARARQYQQAFATHNKEARMTSQNETLFTKAQTHIPGGVNSPVRAFRSVGGAPRFFREAKGAYAWDADGQRYIDYVGSWGPAIVGHAHPDAIRAVQTAAEKGLSFGAPTEGEIEIADLICKLLPSIEMVRLVSSGTEATMSAIRLARGFTGRDGLIKFEGCYHGHSDSLLVKAGSGALTFGNPSSGGVPADLAQHTMVLDYNDVGQLEAAFANHGDKIAAVIVEPVVGNMNLIPPKQEFLNAMRALCTKHGAVLIFDEVMTGFRVGLGCAQGLYGIKPDLTTLGKVIGGGMPLAAFGGRRDIMEKIAPLGPVYQAGTLSGNPLSVAAGLATLKLIQAPGFYENLTARTKALCEGLSAAAKKHGVAFSAQSVGGMFGVYFRASAPQSFAEVMECDKEAFNRFFHAMLAAGVYYAPSAFEAGFVSAAHTEADIADTVAAADAYFAKK